MVRWDPTEPDGLPIHPSIHIKRGFGALIWFEIRPDQSSLIEACQGNRNVVVKLAVFQDNRRPSYESEDPQSEYLVK
jgi:hypothetical protein